MRPPPWSGGLPSPRPMSQKKRESSSGGPWRRRRSGARSPAALQRLAAGGITAHLAAILRFSAATRLPRGDIDCQRLCVRSKADERVAPVKMRPLVCVTARVPRHWPRALASMSPHGARRQRCAAGAALRGCGPVTGTRVRVQSFLNYSIYRSNIQGGARPSLRATSSLTRLTPANALYWGWRTTRVSGSGARHR